MTSSRFIGAVRFATLAHAGQKRKAPKGKNVPYIVHPLEAAQVLTQANVEDEDILIAAVLHDTLEDTETTEADVGFLFGRRVLGIVLQVTDDPSLERNEKKNRQVTEAPHKMYEAKLVKTADKTSNMRDLIRTPPGWETSRIRAYAEHARLVVTALNSQEPLPDLLTSMFWESSQNVFDWCTEREIKENSK